MSDSPLIASAWLRPDYRASLEQAGARIRELTPGDALPGALEGCSGLMLTGGVDVDPREYGEHDVHATVEIDPARDSYELALAREALKRDLPVLAICRGAQVLNTAAGGTLVQDIPSAFPSSVNHRQTEPKDTAVHEVEVKPGTCLWTLLAPRLDSHGAVAVNSRHHQSVKSPGAGFIVSAVSPDGHRRSHRKTGCDVLRRRPVASRKLPVRRRVQDLVRRIRRGGSTISGSHVGITSMALVIDERGVVMTCGACGKRNRVPFGAGANCGQCHQPLPAAAEPLEVPTVAAFEALISRSPLPVVVDFWAPWCGPCLQVAPEIGRVAASHAGQWIIAKVNTEALPALSERFGIRSIPTMAVFARGHEVTRTMGARPAAAIEAFVSQALAD